MFACAVGGCGSFGRGMGVVFLECGLGLFDLDHVSYLFVGVAYWIGFA